MASAQEVSEELLGTNPPPNHHDAVMFEGGPSSLRRVARTVQDKITTAAKEITLFLEGRSLNHEAIQAFLTNPGRKDTTLGHAINAASLTRVNHLILVRLAAKLDVDISDIK